MPLQIVYPNATIHGGGGLDADGDTDNPRDYDADDPRPTTSTMLLGASAGSGGIAGTVTNLSPKMIRRYEGGGIIPSSWAGTSGKAVTDRGINCCHSTKPNISLLAKADQPTIDALIAMQSGRPDVPGEREICWHEPYNKGFTGATWAAATEVYYSKVMPTVNKNRTHPILFDICLQGSTISSGVWSTFFTTTAMQNCDSIGFDCYDTAAQQVADGAAIAANNGKPFSIAECGDTASGTTRNHTDQELADFMTNVMLPALKKVASTTAYALWFNGNNNSLLTPTIYTQACAVWAKASAA